MIAYRVSGDDGDGRAPGLRIAPPKPSAYPVTPCRRRACDHEVLLDHGDRVGRIERMRPVSGQGDDRPIRHPDHEASRRRSQG